ncbi:hypothetical protein, partial [Longimicrobium sp.]|uniref:hypothetical protein n=1 Tax=Longimicrobium sp. TaxID=2029185 RepID=UPI002E35664F
MTGRMRMGWALAVLALVLAARSARAQEGPDARMDAFLRFGRDYGASRELASFFPARGTLLWLLKTRTDDGARRGRWRFDAAELPRATDAATGPLCGSFSHGG